MLEDYRRGISFRCHSKLYREVIRGYSHASSSRCRFADVPWIEQILMKDSDLLLVGPKYSWAYQVHQVTVLYRL